ncbi:amino acid adenylation domain-containing protein [Pigmentibacter sp. JX0631]|uniref:amino acid adenylation domain-containing protein n=1 Tax=Pigmentibacter sp. JX0631 TaxID=2976982 RepID=UPI002468E95B|nr:amino acid adenylation domain-containing protein [Pigmentibacter sp. JX0631]WGL60428.1 amino acid adenylation domain-containing protein [Pigmentibacter sp. JX0631]
MKREIVAPKILLPYYYSWKINENNTNYNVCFSYSLPMNISIEKLKSCILKLVEYRPALRANFGFKNNEVKYYVHDILAPIFYELSAKCEDDFKNLLNKVKNINHDLHNESLIKVGFIRKIYSLDTEIIFNIHHSIIDGTSLDKFILDLSSLYNEGSILEESTESHLNSFLILNKNEQNLNENNIKLYANLLSEISLKNEKISIKNNEIINTSKFALDHSELKKLKAFTEKYNISLFNFLLVCWCIFETKLLNKEFCITNYPVNIRNNKEVSGCMLNNIYFPFIYKKNSNIEEVLKGLKKQLPFLKKLHHISPVDLFDKNDSKLSHFAYSGFAKLRDLQLQNFHIAGNAFPQMANSSLGMRYVETEQSLHLLSECYESILPQNIACELSKRFANFVGKLVDNSTSNFQKIDILFENERATLLKKNVSKPNKDPGNSIVSLFRKISEKFPEKYAAVEGDNKITYKNLNEKSDKLAKFLSAKTSSENIIGILIDNKIEMLIGILGVLKSGNSYLPLSPDTPRERIEYILKDSNVTTVLSLKKYSNLISSARQFYDLEDEILYSLTEKFSAQYQKSPSDLSAYVIYTSGSTGHPKGVLVNQHSVINLIENCKNLFNISENDNISKYSSFSFDASVIEIFVSILNGCTLYFVPEKMRYNINLLNDFFHTNNITFTFLTTKIAEVFMELENFSLKTLLTGGEKLKAFKKNNYNLVNAYGPTETTVFVTSYNVQQYDENIPIGKAIENVDVYILDKELNPCLYGMRGEIYIGGEALAIGYINNDALTKENFIINPFCQEKEEKYNRLYRTGDIGIKLFDDSILISGRLDSQIKICGYRIELSEIEKQLLSFPDIINAAVVAYDDASGYKYLCAYIEGKSKIIIEELEEYLNLQLPEYMLPKKIIQLEKIPLNYNGKTDIKALKMPKDLFTISKVYFPPINSYEEKISTFFKEILQIERVNRTDDFFSLGGNSIKAIQLITRMQKSFNIDISSIYKLRSIDKIAEKVRIDEET